LSKYRDVERNNAEPWDELEKSIIANLADDVIVSVKGHNVEIVIMKNFDKSELSRLASLDDATLWESIRNIASQHGYELSDRNASHEDLERVRSILRGSEKFNMREAARLINTYKKR
jgi:hypothetical protein